ncbi:hypothetical protein ACEE10_11915 [Staphylococcus simulans]|uniref:hypothetical protein n=1 Tax=Staphylococcus simulans TaxID=1286 RepID=UPI000D1F0292|nr:hypothetical protein [Staphylococcus simulans]MDY5059566.1 hypothetical protein [Staphylococcus simulans]PTJ13042.1 hypothetical protein BU038_11855 [Staphylococcus simulans]
MKKFLTYTTAVASLSLLLTGCSGQQEKKTSDANAQTQQDQPASSSKDIKINKEKLSSQDQAKLKQEVMKWADKRAKQQGLAASNRYFGAGEISTGDWYAMTPKGELQVSNQNEPGPKAFERHNLVGVVFYHSNQGVTGFDEKAKDLSNIEGYRNVADLNQPITKYLFADDGKVYEYQFKPSQQVTLSSGFAPKDHNDKDPNLRPDELFKATEDETATELMNQLIKQYGKQ